MKNKKSLIAIIALFLVIGVTIAYFQSSASFENIFNTGTYKVVTTEVFESPDNWKPGEEIPKTITTTNEGTIPAAVRVSYTEQWLDSDNNDITSTIDEGTAIINLDNTNEWTKEGNYYYYNYILEPNETTSSFMKSVTLNPNLNGLICTGEGNTRTCEATNPATGATYKLTITKETVQADKYQEVWNTQVNIIEKPNALSIGDDVNYVTSLNGVTLDDWKVFYVDSDYTYIILGDYLLNAAVSSNVQSNYNLYTNEAYVINATYSRVDLINAITTKSNWDSLLTGTINGHAVNETQTANVWAMGAPTLDLWVNSWNATYPSDTLHTAQTVSAMSDGLIGYYIGYSANTTQINLSSKTGYNNTLYFPHKEAVDNDNCYGYWLASPSAEDEYTVIGLGYYGSVGSTVYYDGEIAFRPVIKLPTSILNQ